MSVQKVTRIVYPVNVVKGIIIQHKYCFIGSNHKVLVFRFHFFEAALSDFKKVWLARDLALGVWSGSGYLRASRG